MKSEYNYRKWEPIVDYVGVTDSIKRDWLIGYLQSLEDNGDMNYRTPEMIEFFNNNVLPSIEPEPDRNFTI